MTQKHEKPQQPNKALLSQTRRSALKKMLVGTSVAAGTATLPSKWTKPLVDRVLVPAHAQTSSTPYFDTIQDGGYGGSNDLLCIASDGSNYLATYVHIMDGTVWHFTHTIASIGTGVTMTSVCDSGGFFNVTSVTTTEAFYTFDELNPNTPTGSIPVGSCDLPAENCQGPVPPRPKRKTRGTLIKNGW